MSDFLQTYDHLVQELKRLDYFASSLALLSWDEQVLMPTNSAELRGHQKAVLSDLYHRESTQPKIDQWLQPLEANRDALSPEQQVVVDNARKDFDRSAKIPPEFVARKSMAETLSYQAWTKARQENDFTSFAPHIKTMLELAQEEASILGAEKPYDYWIDRFDPGMDEATIDALFVPLRKEIIALVQQIENSGITPRSDFLKSFPINDQEAILMKVVKAFGFDFSTGRIDQSVHPFCSGHPLDTRITTRYQENNPLDSLSSAMHETGHALYEQGLPKAHLGTALGSAVGMAVHESQSRMWENQVGRSREFWQFWGPQFQEKFPSQLRGVDVETLFRAANRVEISPIRVDADEITYNLHIMLRFAIEKKLFSGQLAIEDLPEAWNTLSREFLGYTPKNNAEGCLQDVHWAAGLFGYFPSYTLGNMVAAQLWFTIQDALPGLQDDFSKGSYERLLNWLRSNVHALGRRYQTQAFVEKVTHKPLNHTYLVRYLKERYLPLYSSNSDI